MKSHCQILLRHRNQSRRGEKQEIQGLRCLNRSITQNIQEYIFRQIESMNIQNLGVAVGFGSSSSISGLDDTPRCES